MEQVIIMLNEISQIERSKYCLFFLICELKTSQCEARIVIPELGEGLKEGWLTATHTQQGGSTSVAQRSR